MKEHDQLLDEQICTHFGEDSTRFHGAVVPPIYQNSLFTFESFEKFIDAISNDKENYLYWRGMNPTVEIVEKKIAALEGGEKCKTFASGMGAISAAISTFVNSGDHVLCVSNIYGPTMKFLQYLHKFGVEYSVVSSTDLQEIEAAIRPNTAVIYLESPTTMTFKLVDLEAVAQLAKQRGIKTIIDNTWATPIYQKPILLGIDIVVHSASKYLGGHSDLVGGVLITSKENMDQIFSNEYQLYGAVMAPYEAWLLMRGIRTLPIRMKAHQESALKVAQFLEGHPAVKRVNHPGLESHADYALGRKQLKGYSGLFSFELVHNSFENVKNVINALHIFQIGVSWGGFESLALSPNFGHNEEGLAEQGIDTGLIRLSIGLENTEALIEDLKQALDSIL